MMVTEGTTVVVRLQMTNILCRVTVVFDVPIGKTEIGAHPSRNNRSWARGTVACASRWWPCLRYGQFLRPGSRWWQTYTP